MEYELLETGVFDDDRYFDVFVEYAKKSPEDIVIRITVYNRGPEAARIRVLPTLWFRNTWSWDPDERKPLLRASAPDVIEASHPELGEYRLCCDGSPELLFTENETNAFRLWGQPNAAAFVKDAFHASLIDGKFRGGQSDLRRNESRGALYGRCACPGMRSPSLAPRSRSVRGRLPRLRSDIRTAHRRRRRIL